MCRWAVEFTCGEEGVGGWVANKNDEKTASKYEYIRYISLGVCCPQSFLSVRNDFLFLEIIVKIIKNK